MPGVSFWPLGLGEVSGDYGLSVVLTQGVLGLGEHDLRTLVVVTWGG